MSTSVSKTFTYSRRKTLPMNDSVNSTEKSGWSGGKKGLTSHVELHTVKEDPARLETMTVQELRTLMRSVGVSAKGSKKELVSSLRDFLDKQDMGGNSSFEDKHTSVASTSKTYSKRKRNVDDSSGLSPSLNLNTTATTLAAHRRRKGGQQLTDDKATAKSVQLRHTLATNMDIKPITTKEKGLSGSQKEDGGSADTLVVPTRSNEPWSVLAHKKPQLHWVPYNPRTMRRPVPDGMSIKIMSWNVNGLRALLKVENTSMLELAKREDFDVLCLQETKLQEKDVKMIKETLLEGYDNSFWTCSVSKLGYSGTAIISRIKPLSVKYGLGALDHDSEGRLVTVEFDGFYLLCAYVPNSGDGLKRLSYRIGEWDPSLSNYMKALEKSKPIILTGDLNCAHEEIDIHDPAGNRRSAGFTKEERESFGLNFLSKGFVDTFRKQHPGVVGYTYWGYRHRARTMNKGWRLDYFLVSESIADKVHDSYTLPEINGSDHCPIGLILKM